MIPFFRRGNCLNCFVAYYKIIDLVINLQRSHSKMMANAFILQTVLEAYRQSSPDDSECKIKFQKAFAKVLDDVQSVINSPHTRKEKRETISALCENAQDVMKDIFEKQKDNKVNLKNIFGIIPLLIVYVKVVVSG